MYHFDGGVCVPKVNIGAIRGGQPFIPIVSAEQCYLYLDVRLTPAQTAMEVQAELRDVLAAGRRADAASSARCIAAATRRRASSRCSKSPNEPIAPNWDEASARSPRR